MLMDKLRNNMIIGIVTRINKKTNIEKLYITNNYKKIFDKLNITLFPIVSTKNIKKNSFIYEFYSKEKENVNSFHIQSIKKVANNFKVTATAEDGTIEAIENGNIIGVQWHPEKENNIEFFEHFIKRYISKEQIEE